MRLQRITLLGQEWNPCLNSLINTQQHTGAVILQLLRNLPNHFGYTTLFLLTIVYFALGTLVIRKVRNVK